MKITDVNEETFPTFACCFEEWSEEMKNARKHKRIWYDYMKPRGLGAKVAVDDDGEVSGMIQYIPSQYSFIEGDGIYLITCIWVYGYEDKGIGCRQNRGMGKALLLSAEEDVKDRGAKGIAAWGLSEPFWMPSAFYKRFGYSLADTTGIQELVWKAFSSDVKPPKWRKAMKKPHITEGKVTVTAFRNGWCPSFSTVYENFKKASAEFGENVEFREIDTISSKAINEWGITDSIFINERELEFGPPPGYDEAYRMIKEQVEKLK